MRVALISDVHLDRAHLWDETRRVLDWIADDIASRDVAAVLMGGDLFERRPTAEELDAAAAWLQKLGAIAPVVGVYGNHDPVGTLEVLNKLETRYPVVIYDRPAVHALDGLTIACLPWPRRAALLAALGDVPHERANEIAAEALRDLLRGFGAQLDERRGARLFLGHCMVRGSRVSTGQPLAPGADFELGLEDLGLVRAHAYLLGHIHLGAGANAWTWNGAPIFFPGSPVRRTFGELEQKAYALVDVDGDGAATVTYVPTPATPMVLVDDEWGQDGGSEFYFLRDPSTAPLLEGARVRFRYRVDPDRRDAARAAAEKVAESYRRVLGAIDVKVEEIVNATTRTRAPEVAAAPTLESKLRAYWRSRGEELGARAERVIRLARGLEG